MVASNLSKKEVDRMLIRGIEIQRRAIQLHYLDELFKPKPVEPADLVLDDETMIEVLDIARQELFRPKDECDFMILLGAISLAIDELKGRQCG